MASGRAYWYPDPAGSLESTDIGDLFSDIQEPDSAVVEDSYGLDGTPYRMHLATTKRVRFIFERFGPHGSSATERALKSLEAHLFKGGFIGISGDHTKTWAGRAASAPVRGDTVMHTSGGNGFTSWSAAGEPAAGDEIVVESAHPEAQREIVVASAPTVHPPIHLTIDSPGVIYTYASPVIVRYRDFYPVCWLPKDQVGKPIVFSDHRRNFTLDITLEYCLAATLALWEDGELPELALLGGAFDGMPALRSTGSGGFGGSSLQELLSPLGWSF